ncbi:hypothetical protein Tco_0450039 [Tanacetum coccineum]
MALNDLINWYQSHGALDLGFKVLWSKNKGTDKVDEGTAKDIRKYCFYSKVLLIMLKVLLVVKVPLLCSKGKIIMARIWRFIEEVIMKKIEYCLFDVVVEFHREMITSQLQGKLRLYDEVRARTLFLLSSSNRGIVGNYRFDETSLKALFSSVPSLDPQVQEKNTSYHQVKKYYSLVSTMLKSIHLDHQDTAHYIPMYHRIGGFTEHEREVYKSLISRLIHEGRTIDSTFLDDQPNLRPTFAAIGFDCLLDINKKSYPIFVLQFYKSVRLNRVCVYTPDWPISSLQYVGDPHPDIYPPSHKDSSLIRDALYYKRTQPKTQKMKGIDTILNPFQMIVSELKIEFKKWEVILSENAISLAENKDHPNACLCYMLYCLAIEKTLQPHLLYCQPNGECDQECRYDTSLRNASHLAL